MPLQLSERKSLSYRVSMAKKFTPTIAMFGSFSADELAKVQSEGQAAAEEETATFRQIQHISRQFNQTELLARLAFVAIAEQSKFGSPDFKPSIFPFELELFQAVALASELRSDWDQRSIAQGVENTLALLRRNSEAFKKKSGAKLTGDRQTDRLMAVLDRIRVTMHSVRGPRHAFQTRAYLRGLAAGLDDKFKAELGFTLTTVINLLEATAFRIDKNLQGLRDISHRWMAATQPDKCLELFLEDNPDCADHLLIAEVSTRVVAISEMKGTLFAIFEEKLKAIFQLCREDADEPSASDALWNALENIALGFGDVKADLLEHLHLSNPVVTRPLVSDGTGNYYLFCAQSTFANLVEIIDVLAAAKPKLKAALESFKADWLEKKLNELVGAAFPAGKAHPNAKWVDLDQKPGETDCILLIDKTVGLFEAKSARVTPPARRGAHDRLRRDIKALLVDPSQQSYRFESLLRSSPEPVTFSTKQGEHEIAGADVREVFRINILFDTIGPLSTNTRRLVEAGLIDVAEPMAPCMSIFELETLLDVLPDQIARIHYLRRRCDLERNSMIEADEMDLIAFYLDGCFHMGDLEFSEDGFSIYGWSDRIARMYDHEGRRKNVDVTLKRTPMWTRLLNAIEDNRETGWTRFGYRLCETRYADQWSVQKMKEKSFRKARKVKVGQATFTGGFTEGGKMPLAICVGNRVSEFGIYSHSQTAALSMMDMAKADQALALYWDISEPDLPYKFVATFLRQSPPIR
jgi:hypothetical protein